MKKVLLIALAICLAFAGVALAGVVGSYHDLSTNGTTSQVCVYCHHPHLGNPPGKVGNGLLWNITGWTGAPYEVYDAAESSTMNASNPTGTDVSSSSGYVSYLCMACHDGSIGTNALLRQPRDGTAIDAAITISGAANLGATLEDDHPVNFDYSLAGGVDPGIQPETSTALVDGAGGNYDYPLFSGEMQCATCHDVHRGTVPSSLPNDCTADGGTSCDQNIQFMLGNTAASEICTDCHIDK